jgi:hypothetical protein
MQDVPGNCSAMRRWRAKAVAWLKSLAPYATLALLVPGGLILAPALWFYRRYHRINAASGLRV